MYIITTIHHLVSKDHAVITQTADVVKFVHKATVTNE